MARVQKDKKGLDEVAGLFELVGDAGELSRSHQIFCNRELKLGDIDVIGFDMDYTLANYHQEAFDALSVELTVERLIEHRGWPEVLRHLSPRPEFAIRGLVIDREQGNILKMDSFRHVGKAFHGFSELDSDAKRKLYREENIRFNSENRYAFVDTLFALPEAYLFAALIDCMSRKDWKGPVKDGHEVYDDVRYCIDLAHRDGSLKQVVMADLERFLPRGPELAVTLHKFRSSGKRLFLLTNSFSTFTHRVMAYLLDGMIPEYTSWKSYFDVIITGSAKPSFFQEEAPFLIVDEHEEVSGVEAESFSRGVVYQGGNLLDLERMMGCRGERICYIGDHIYGDIVRSKKASAWRTVMIVQEMEHELLLAESLREDVAMIDELDQELRRLSQTIAYERVLMRRMEEGLARLESDESVAIDELGRLRRVQRDLEHSVDRARRNRQRLLLELEEAEEELERKFNPWWGLIFRMGNENTVFGEQVEDFACLYTSRVSNFANYSPLHHFRSPRQPMPHER